MIKLILVFFVVVISSQVYANSVTCDVKKVVRVAKSAFIVETQPCMSVTFDLEKIGNSQYSELCNVEITTFDIDGRMVQLRKFPKGTNSANWTTQHSENDATINFRLIRNIPSEFVIGVADPVENLAQLTLSTSFEAACKKQ